MSPEGSSSCCSTTCTRRRSLSPSTWKPSLASSPCRSLAAMYRKSLSFDATCAGNGGVWPGWASEASAPRGAGGRGSLRWLDRRSATATDARAAQPVPSDGHASRTGCKGLSVLLSSTQRPHAWSGYLFQDHVESSARRHDAPVILEGALSLSFLCLRRYKALPDTRLRQRVVIRNQHIANRELPRRLHQPTLCPLCQRDPAQFHQTSDLVQVSIYSFRS